jgi:methionine-rich copper-binding protein CopC
MVVMLWCVAVPSSSMAHSRLVWTEPEDSATLSSPPDRVMLKFATDVDVVHSAVVVTAPDGSEHQLGAPAASLQGVMSIQVDGRGPSGKWHVRYAVRSWDQHTYGGRFQFDVSSLANGSAHSGLGATSFLLAGSVLLMLAISVVARRRRSSAEAASGP